jgi:hypothetical protein
MSKRKVVESLDHSAGRRNGQRRKPIKTVYSDLLADFCCPIVRELPVQPVVAGDGRIYEKCAIEAHILLADERGRDLRSPITNEQMENTITPVAHVTDTIRVLIDDEVVNKAAADRWIDLRAMLKRAEEGDTSSIHSFASFLEENGILPGAKDWYMKGAALEDVRCMACLGSTLVSSGYREQLELVLYLGRAADRGSDLAVYWLGKAFFNGIFGGHLGSRHSVNMHLSSQATAWLSKFLSGKCPLCHFSNDEARQGAMRDSRDMMRKLNCKKCSDGTARRFCRHTTVEGVSSQDVVFNVGDDQDDDSDDSGEHTDSAVLLL